MRRADIHKLLGGYASGTLSEQERKMLFEAALSDQRLFDALADEHALKELLDDPLYRNRLTAELQVHPRSVPASAVHWIRRPFGWALAGSLAMAVLLVIVLRHGPERATPALEVAQLRSAAEPAKQDAAPQAPVAKREAEPDARKQAQPRRTSSEKRTEQQMSRESGTQPERSELRTVLNPSALEARTKTAPEARFRPLVPPLAAGPTPEAGRGEALIANAPPASIGRKAFTQESLPAAPPPPPPVAYQAQTAGQRPMQDSAVVQVVPDRNRSREAYRETADLGSQPEKSVQVQSKRKVVIRMASAELSMLECKVLRKGPSGEYVEADPATDLRSGDFVRLRLVPAVDGDLSIVQASPDGSRISGLAPEQKRLRARNTYLIPEGEPLKLDGVPGTETLSITFSPAPHGEAGLVAGARADAPRPVQLEIKLSWR